MRIVVILNKWYRSHYFGKRSVGWIPVFSISFGTKLSFSVMRPDRRFSK